MAAKKIIYFIAGQKPTTEEAAEIADLQATVEPDYTLSVRSNAGSPIYSDDNLEPCDYVAGTVPTAYNAVDEFDPEKLPVALQILPATVSIDHEATQQLQVLKAGGSLQNLSLDDVSAAAKGTTYESSDETKATVGVNGLVTAVAAGTTTITATHEYDTGETVTATRVITVTGS